MSATRAIPAMWVLLLLTGALTARAARQQREASVSSGKEGGNPIDENSPVGKVLALLGELRSQLQEDADADRRQVANFTTWYEGETKRVGKIIEDTNEKISILSAELKRQEALRQDRSLDLQKEAAKLTKSDKDLADATGQRATEHKFFEANEAKLLESIDQLERALIVMGKQMTNEEAGKTNSASLVDVAKKVRSILLQGQDFDLGIAQREVLDGFVRTALRRGQRTDAPGGSLRGGAGEEVLAPDFLQVGDAAGGPYGGYESGGSTATTALQSVLDKAKKELEDVRKQEETQRKSFEQVEKGLKSQIKVIKGAIASAKTEISESQERTGQSKTELLAAQELQKVSKKGIEEIEVDFLSKNTSFEERKRKRADEILAVEEASTIMNSSDMKRSVLDHWSDPGSTLSFLQLQQASRRKAIGIVRAATSPGLALLALRTQTRALRSRRADPFGKVTQLIREMIDRLQQAASGDETRSGWCESEMAKSGMSVSTTTAAVEKLEGRIAEIDSEMEQLDADIKRIQQELKDMAKATTEATDLRGSERMEAESSVVRYQDAQRLLKSAVTVLRRIYAPKEPTPQSGGGAGPGGGYKVSGMGQGIIGLLEISIENFEQLQQETESAEKTAQKDYKELMDTTEVQSAAFNKDLEYKNREKVKLSGDKMRAQSDLKNYEKELTALQKYIEELKAQCQHQETYEERKARREAEIKSLKEALTHLSTEE